ncbi:MAG: PmoA family protein [bacterium]
MMSRVALLAFAHVALYGSTIAAQTSSPNYVQVVAHDADRRVDVLVGGKPFTSYVYPTSLKKPVLYPLRAASGTVVTRGYPLDPRPGERVDHPHHVGLWFNYGNVNGLDFWNNSTAIKDSAAPKMGTIFHRGVRGAKSGAGEGTLDVTSEWVNYQGKPLIKEDTHFIFRAHDGYRSIDRVTTLTALDNDVAFPDDKEGVIGMRVARGLEQPSTTAEKFLDASGRPTDVPVLDNTGVTGKYTSSEGKEGDAVWGTRGKWAMLTGVVDKQPITLAMLDYPKNPGFPTYWHARGYGLFAANNLGQKILSNGKDELNFKISAGTSVTFRHRILILDGTATPAEIEKQFAEFSK